MKTYDVTLRVYVEDDAEPPDRWNWAVLLDLPDADDVRVVSCRPLSRLAAEPPAAADPFRTADVWLKCPDCGALCGFNAESSLDEIACDECNHRFIAGDDQRPELQPSPVDFRQAYGWRGDPRDPASYVNGSILLLPGEG